MTVEKSEQLRQGVCQVYSMVAARPQAQHLFPVGRHFAESLGYPPDLLHSLPPVAVDAFTGVSHVSLLADIPTGATVLDLGCGAGLDALIAARRTGPGGRVLGVDFSETMLTRARQAAAEIKADHVAFDQADAEHLRLADGTVDVALINGLFNLNPTRTAIFQELARVMRPDGVVYAAELILREPLPPDVRQSEWDWFS